MEDGKITSNELSEDDLLEIRSRRSDNKLIGEELDNGGVVVSDSFAKDFINLENKTVKY
jgi:hypothetical protein